MRQSDCVITTAQQAAALLFALASKSQATCSVRLYCHCPRDDVSEIDTQGCGNQQPSQLGNEKQGLGQQRGGAEPGGVDNAHTTAMRGSL